MVNVESLYESLCGVLDKSKTPPTLDDLAPFQSEILEVIGQIKRLDDSTWQAPSPWHAAILCIYWMAEYASGEPLDENRRHISDISQLKSVPAIHLAFRGECDYTRPMRPAYWRGHNDANRPKLKLTIDNLAALLKYASDKMFGGINIEIGNFVGAVQHYMSSTSLLDWTTDPRVAVAFAADYAPKANLSVVYVLPMFRAVEQGAKFFLPPPWVERLYKQCGFFIEPEQDADDAALQDSCMSLRFPSDQRFKVHRDGADLDTLLHPLGGMDDLIKHCRELADNNINLVDESQTIDELTKALEREWAAIVLPPFLRPEGAEKAAEQWLWAVLDMLDRFSHLRTNEGLKASPFILKAVVCNNKTVMGSLIKWLEIQEGYARDVAKREDAARGWGDLAALLKDVLASC